MTEPNSKLPNLNTQTEEFITLLEEEDAPPLYKLTPQDARDFLNKLQNKHHKDIEAQVSDTNLYLEPARHLNVRVVRPKSTKSNTEKLHAILYIHGGGWVIGGIESYDMLIRKLAVCTNSVVIFPDYPLSPEEKYPTAINLIYSLLEYIYDSPEQFNIDKNKIAIAGDSVGGNMATVTAMRAKNKKGPKIACQVLFYPVTNADMDTKSYESFKDGPWLSHKAMEWFFDAYADKKLRNDIYISPLKAEEEDLEGLPPTLVVTAENDVLRDEGEAYARKLDSSGIEVTSVRMNGTIHDFMMINALSDTPAAKAALSMACEFIKDAFSK